MLLVPRDISRLSKLTVSFRNDARFVAPLWLLTRDASSPSTTSSVQCSVFSILQ